MGKAQKSGLVEYKILDFRTAEYPIVDDYAFGGGSGMVLKVDPIVHCLRVNSLLNDNTYKILLTPSGLTFNQQKARDLLNIAFSKSKDIVLLCGHYEGFDARIEDYFDAEISIGDFVITSGELAAMVVIDAVTRLIPGVLNESSVKVESFDSDLLDFPVYTRPREFEGKLVPEILLSGNHQEIEKYRIEERIKVTKKKRPDLYQLYKRRLLQNT